MQCRKMNLDGSSSFLFVYVSKNVNVIKKYNKMQSISY